MKMLFCNVEFAKQAETWKTMSKKCRNMHLQEEKFKVQSPKFKDICYLCTRKIKIYQ